MTAVSATWGWALEAVLYLLGIDVLAAGSNHVLLAVDNVEEAVSVGHGHVAGMDPAVDDGQGRGLRILPVAGHVRALEAQLPRIARRDGPILVVEKGDFHARDGPADRSPVLEYLLGPTQCDERATLGETEGVRHLAAALPCPESVRRPLHDAARVVGAVVHQAHRGDVGRREGRVIEQLVQHRRHAQNHGDPLSRQGRQHFPGVELAQQDDPSAEEHEQLHVVPVADVKGREVVHVHVGALGLQGGGHGEGVVDRPAVGEHGPLGSAGRARGVEDHVGIAVLDLRRRTRAVLVACRDERLPIGAVMGCHRHGQHAGTPGQSTERGTQFVLDK